MSDFVGDRNSVFTKNEEKTNLVRSQKEGSFKFTFFWAASANGTAQLMSATVATFVSAFMTDVMLIPAALCSLIMLISTAWDAINDPIMGVIADRTSTKWGKYRPWLIPAPILLTLFSVLMWLNPDLPTTGKAVFFLIVYIGYGMTTTMYTMPHVALLPACVQKDEDRNRVIHLGAIFSTLAFSFASSFTTQITAFFENTLGVRNGYVPMMLIYGVLSMVTFWGLFGCSKEKYVVETEKKVSAKEVFKVLGDKAIWPLVIIWLTFFIGYGLNFSSAVYYLTYYMGNPGLITPFFLMNTVTGFISIGILFPIFMKLFRGPHNVFKITLLVSIICYVILFIFGSKSVPLMFALSGFVNLFTTLQFALIQVLINDAIDYTQWKTGHSANGIVASIKGFAQKCGNTITSSGMLAILAVSGYIPNAIGAEPTSAMFAINAMRFGIPVIFAVIQIFCLSKDPAIIYKTEIDAMKMAE
ncbi:glycoside/pentoside/hexuronide:cation symporter, GPH family [Pseudobutyrivibrio sp. C4]|uniref:MFS transporter n=1 Tax=Pseudobutyrivibrio sp. C4 TaxID=1520803 RepID=UPI0008CFC9A2|nr:MFS transporter [Pseudobutyrivibrio sp. C4]SET19727.1 glycoside/pentoside/hexuronide:cation symporter, GPH family [Pseudobutyrivibrio sp. C4]